MSVYTRSPKASAASNASRIFPMYARSGSPQGPNNTTSPVQVLTYPFGDGSLTILGGTANLYDKYHIRGSGYYKANGGAAPALYAWISLGSTTIIDTAVDNLNLASQIKGFDFDLIMEFKSLGTSGTVSTRGFFINQTGATSQNSRISTVTISRTINTTIDNAFRMDMQLGTNPSPSNYIYI